MRAAAAAILMVAASLLGAGCDGNGGKAGTTTGKTDAMSVSVYMLRGGKVSPVRRTIDSTPAVARAVLASLLAGPTTAERAHGLTTAIPRGTTLGGIELVDGVATVDLRLPSSASPEKSRREVAQIVASLTRVPGVHAVRFGGGRAWNRRAIEQQLPQILVESPLPGERVAGPLRVRGTANVFEATVSLEVRQAGAVVRRAFTTATSGNGMRGTFDTEIALPHTSGPITIVAFEASAEDGRPLHVVQVPVTLDG